jgi:23S rRNA-/tRNA-specific pseudouridylate synthase
MSAGHVCIHAARPSAFLRFSLVDNSMFAAAATSLSLGLRPSYEDDQLAVVYKPAGVCTSSTDFEESLSSLLAKPAECPDLDGSSISMRLPFGKEDSLPEPQPVHNLDATIVGLCICSKSRATSRFCISLLEARRVETAYHAILAGNAWEAGAAAADEDGTSYRVFDAAVAATVADGDAKDDVAGEQMARFSAGSWRWAWRRWDSYGAHPTKKGAKRILDLYSQVDGVDVGSHIEVLRVVPHPKWGHVSHVRITPDLDVAPTGSRRSGSAEAAAEASGLAEGPERLRTGHMHQVRLHAAALGCPVVGDRLYWRVAAAVRRAGAPGVSALSLRSAGTDAGGLCLAQCAVSFEHPVDGSLLSVAVAEPAEWRSRHMLTAEQRRVGLQYEAEKRYEADKGFYRY